MSIKNMRILASPIIDRAINDWFNALSLLEDNPDYEYTLDVRREIEDFFEKEWFSLLCEINLDFTKIHLQEMRA